MRADWSYLGCHCIMIFSGRNWEGKAVVLYEVWTVLVLQEKEGDWFLKLADEQSSAVGLQNTTVKKK